MENVNRQTRRLWNCGYLPESEWTHGAKPAAGMYEQNGDACPGYYVSLPAVHEAAMAHAWWEKGQLRDHCDGETPTRILRDCVTILCGAYGEIEEYMIREAKETR